MRRRSLLNLQHLDPPLCVTLHPHAPATLKSDEKKLRSTHQNNI